MILNQGAYMPIPDPLESDCALRLTHQLSILDEDLYALQKI